MSLGWPVSSRVSERGTKAANRHQVISGCGHSPSPSSPA